MMARMFLLVSSLSLVFKAVSETKPRYFDDSLPLPISSHEIYYRPRRRLSPVLDDSRNLKSELTPLYPGYGTHYCFVYVGTPPQRQSVIVDTGSHRTAFPCTNCQQCGIHTDPYWDAKNSSTVNIPQCNHSPCPVSESYSEGSSWKGYQVVDKFWVGGDTLALVTDGPLFSTDFSFACQTFETGLFRTQLEEGIMGMSMSEDTIPAVLKKAGLTETHMFTLCYREGGGIMTLGGVDQRVHLPGEAVNFAKLSSHNGWFGVTLVEISFEDRNSGQLTSIPITSNHRSIIDSGTTDTYFPTSISHSVREAFSKLAGVAFSNDDTAFSKTTLDRFPAIIFTFRPHNESDPPVKVTMPSTSYVENVGHGKHALRLYLNEPSGFILGANFMMGYNVIFDQDGGRVGFAKSECNFDSSAAITPIESMKRIRHLRTSQLNP